MSDTDVQHFTENGTWVKPDGAARVEITLKGGTGGTARPGGIGGRGGDPSMIPAAQMAAGGGGGAGASSHPLPGAPASAGAEGGTASASFGAAELPAELAVTVGAGGFAHIITYLEPQEP